MTPKQLKTYDCDRCGDEHTEDELWRLAPPRYIDYKESDNPAVYFGALLCKGCLEEVRQVIYPPEDSD